MHKSHVNRKMSDSLVSNNMVSIKKLFVVLDGKINSKSREITEKKT